MLIVLSPVSLLDWLPTLSSYGLALCFVHVVEDQILCFVASETWPYQATRDELLGTNILIFYDNCCGLRRAYK